MRGEQNKSCRRLSGLNLAEKILAEAALDNWLDIVSRNEIIYHPDERIYSIWATKHPCFLVAMVLTDSLEWLQTLADVTRVRLLRLLELEELSVSELCSVVQSPQSTVSRHLKVLAEDHWVASRRDGTAHRYRVELDKWPTSRQGLWQWVKEQSETHATLLDQQRLARVLAERSRSEAFFTSTAEQWDRLRVELFGYQLDAFAVAGTLDSRWVVGELGCGSGALCHLLSPFVHEVIGIDSSAAMVGAATQRLHGVCNVRIVKAALEEVPLSDNVFDVAWLVLVLPYVDDPVSVLREAGRLIRPGASLIIADLLPHDRENYRSEMGHVRLGVDAPQLNSWLSESGLVVAKYLTLPPDPLAKGPALFQCIVKRACSAEYNR